MWATSSYKSRCMSWRPCLTPPSDPPGGAGSQTRLHYNIISTFLTALFRFNADEFLSIEELPAPKKVQPKEPEPERPKPAVSRQVGIADQIAIRSYVLGKGAKTSE